MVKLIRFSRDNDLNAWFAEIPEWKGDRAELEMVMGADALLEVLAQGGDYITIRMGDEPVIDKSPNTSLLSRIDDLSFSACSFLSFSSFLSLYFFLPNFFLLYSH